MCRRRAGVRLCCVTTAGEVRTSEPCASAGEPAGGGDCAGDRLYLGRKGVWLMGRTLRWLFVMGLLVWLFTEIALEFVR